MGSFEMTASDGFTFPVRPNNPTGLPVLRFFLTTHQSEPVSGISHRLWEFGPGGHEAIPIMIGYGVRGLFADLAAHRVWLPVGCLYLPAVPVFTYRRAPCP